MPSTVETLIEINLDDLVSSFGWQGRRILDPLLRRVFHKPAVRFAQQMAEFDAAVGTS